MKSYACLLLISVLLMLNACKKAPVTKPVKFTSTTYQKLGKFDSLGKPTYLSNPDTISAELNAFARNTLPDGNNLPKSNPELFTTSAIADITIGAQSDVYITFVSEGSGYANSLAFYTYPTGQSPTSAKDIKLMTYIVPNCGNQTP
jgi:hypothetical protein